MENVSLIAKNEDACKLLDCFVAYKRLVSAGNDVETGKACDFDAHLSEFVETKPRLAT